MKSFKNRHLIFLLTLLVLVFALTACNNNNEDTEKNKENNEEQENTEEKNNVKKEDEADENGKNTVFTDTEPVEKEDLYLNDELHKVAVKGGELTGILTYPTKPENPSDIPIVLIVPGSGAPPKNGLANEMGLLSEVLARNGIASFRYDKRGTYDSNSIMVDESKLKVSDFVEDIDALINYLKADKRFKKVFVLGHSQGGLFACLAIKDNVVDGFISVSAPGRNVGDLIIEQVKNNPMNPPEIIKEVEKIVFQLKQKKPVDEINPLLEPLFRKSLQNYLIDWMLYNPVEEYKKLKDVPVLIIQGTNDIQVSVDDAKILSTAFPEGNPVLIEKMSHILKDAPTKDDYLEHRKIYSNVKAPLNEEFVKTLVDFINNGNKKEE